MKKTFFIIILLVSKISADTAIETAIMKSNPDLLKIELDRYIKKGKPLSKRDQIKYLDLSEEIVIRRRNLIAFPYSLGLSCDEQLRTMSVFKVFAGSLGTVLVFGSLIGFAEEQKLKNKNVPPLAILLFLALEGLLTYTFIDGLREWSHYAKQPQILYEGAIKVRQIIFDIQEIE